MGTLCFPDLATKNLSVEGNLSSLRPHPLALMINEPAPESQTTVSGGF